MSERPQRRAGSGAGAASYNGEEVRSGDASLQQTSVLGPGDGCGMKPEGNANEIQGVVTDCYKGRPGSGGSSLESVSHLQRSAGSCSASVLPDTGTHSQLNRKPLNPQLARCPTKDPASEDRHRCEEMNELVEDVLEVCLTRKEPAAQTSKLGSLLGSVSWLVQDAHQLLGSPRTLYQVASGRLQSIGARWSRHIVSLVKEMNVLSVVTGSRAFSVVGGSFVSSLLKELPLVQHIPMNITQRFQTKDAAWTIQGRTDPDDAPLPASTPAQTTVKELRDDEKKTSEDLCEEDSPSTQKDSSANTDVEHRGEIREFMLQKQINVTDVMQAPKNKENSKLVHIAVQTLIEYPDPLSTLQNLPLRDMMETLRPIIPTSVFPSQQGISLYWLNVAKCSKPEPQPGLLILMDSDLCTLTVDSGLLVLFHHLPVLQLKEIQIGLAGQSVRLMGSTEESVLGVYTHSQQITKELCWAILDVCPGDCRPPQNTLLHEDLMKLLLDCQLCVPDLLLDAEPRLCCSFQRSCANLVYLIHCNMSEAGVALGDLQLLLYTSVAVQISPGAPSKRTVQFFLTDTHLGVVREDVLFHPAPQFVTAAACRPHFHDLTIRPCSGVRCVLVHNEDESGSVRLDVILSDARAGGHPESAMTAAAPSGGALNSAPHAEVWKLTFSCSAEAACLINHLSNV